jgi:lipoic acid synthetase
LVSNPLVRSSYHAYEQVRALSVVHRKLYGEDAMQAFRPVGNSLPVLG